MSLLHAALDVEDIETSASFYSDVVGYEPMNELTDSRETRNMFIGRGRQPDLQLREIGESVDPEGMDHLGLNCPDVDEAVDRVDDNSIIREPTALEESNVRIAFVEDPDGYVIELIQVMD